MLANFDGLRVLSLESRRAKEIGQLIANNGGMPMVAPSTREVPSGPNDEELKFAADLQQDQYGAVILLTGAGTRILAQAIESVLPREQFVAALSRTKVVARGPKPIAVLREFGVPVALAVPEPNTWREILQSLDQNSDKIPLNGKLVAVQEYGVPSPELYAGLSERGAEVFPVPVYKWRPPEDTCSSKRDHGFEQEGSRRRHVHFVGADSPPVPIREESNCATRFWPGCTIPWSHLSGPPPPRLCAILAFRSTWNQVIPRGLAGQRAAEKSGEISQKRHAEIP